MYIGSSSSSVAFTAFPSAPDDVSMSCRAGQSRSDIMIKPAAAAIVSDLAALLISDVASQQSGDCSLRSTPAKCTHAEPRPE